MTHRTPKAAAGGWGSSLRPQTQHVGLPEAWQGAQPTEALQRPVQTGRRPAARGPYTAQSTGHRSQGTEPLGFTV